MFGATYVVFFEQEDILNNHLTTERLEELLRETGPEFTKDELRHVTDCQTLCAGIPQAILAIGKILK